MQPIFVCGCPRSGTTLLGAMLGAHSECIAVPETQFLLDALGAVDRGEIVATEEAVLAWIRRHPRFRTWGLETSPSLASSSTEDPLAVARAMRGLSQRWAERQGKPECHRWVDHTPTHARHGSVLRRLFPRARFVHLVRDGRGVAASLAPLDWGPGNPIDAARWWAEQVAHGLALESAVGEPVLRVRFEDLLASPHQILQQICAHVELDHQPSMERADGFSPPRTSRRQHALVGSPPDASRAGAWRSGLSRREVEIFESQASDLLQHLGYEPLFGTRARRPTRSERLRFAAHELIRQRLSNPIRRRLRRRSG